MTEVYYKDRHPGKKFIEIVEGSDCKAAVKFWQHFCMSDARRSDGGDESRVEGESN
jgi:hypothetical protein